MHRLENEGVSLCWLAGRHTHAHTPFIDNYSTSSFTLPLQVGTCLDRKSSSQQRKMKHN